MIRRAGLRERSGRRQRQPAARASELVESARRLFGVRP
jgi:hypothetical protein